MLTACFQKIVNACDSFLNLMESLFYLCFYFVGVPSAIALSLVVGGWNLKASTIMFSVFLGLYIPFLVTLFGNILLVKRRVHSKRESNAN
ncbi:MAG: hypothetical protein A3C71_01190 [Candidatus Yanofskybacteria bacterium RIFCSPHIGHO2_02_FULL_43_15c]|uniref:Uncharacterized protein n=1 Tax=Candidatus Yanofskybacteria bacterium RIFCSPHIGHO2_02_FULL_43_15c TaxID=1802679 RepID=A0A1F8FGZ1_9BACT|nr:MAG: hypothetical protein A3C71_01190 [Candidatus Yanofskybacteria bacterium RIFCSPHIGHO2_02_FULL_43_15c]OGN20957.1 MAG: hypothetical protein A2915_02760 [Candidatus Yanofskybacteria bacterium RIFCSPLOWO2_01_FULL_41_34]